MRLQLAGIDPVENSPSKRKRIFLKLYQLWQNHSCDLKFEEKGLASLQDRADAVSLLPLSPSPRPLPVTAQESWRALLTGHSEKY